MKAKSFTDLLVWQKAHDFILKIYYINKSFPKDELFGLTSQIKRAAVSITSNLAEGFVRRSLKEKIQFYYISLGSLTEVQNQLLIARDLKYISESIYMEINNYSIEIAKMINSLIKSLASSLNLTTS